MSGQHSGYRQHARESVDCLLTGLAQRLFGFTVLGRDRNRRENMALADLNAVNHAECDNIATLTVFYGSQRIENLFFGNVRHI